MHSAWASTTVKCDTQMVSPSTGAWGGALFFYQIYLLCFCIHLVVNLIPPELNFIMKVIAANGRQRIRDNPEYSEHSGIKTLNEIPEFNPIFSPLPNLHAHHPSFEAPLHCVLKSAEQERVSPPPRAGDTPPSRRTPQWPPCCCTASTSSRSRPTSHSSSASSRPKVRPADCRPPALAPSSSGIPVSRSTASVGPAD